MESAASDTRQRARRHFDAAEYDRCLQVACEGLSAAPDDVELLVLAGRAGVEMDADDAVGHLRHATELAPQDAGTWHYLGEALAAEGRTAEADEAFRRAVELDPDDELALTHLGHTSLASGRREEGVDYLARAADLASGTSTAVISLVDMYRSAGQFAEALAQAERLAEAAPDDVLGWLDVAELSLVCGHLDQSLSAFERIRELDDVPGHEVYPLHGLIQVEIRREDWERARQLADQIAAVDPVGPSAELLAFIDERRGISGDHPAPSRSEVDAALSSSLASYRWMLADDRRLSGGELIG
jgi:tetratricopeptide (TPR) repeat protein